MPTSPSAPVKHIRQRASASGCRGRRTHWRSGGRERLDTFWSGRVAARRPAPRTRGVSTSASARGLRGRCCGGATISARAAVEWGGSRRAGRHDGGPVRSRLAPSSRVHGLKTSASARREARRPNEAPRAERSAARRTKRRAPNEAPRAERSAARRTKHRAPNEAPRAERSAARRTKRRAPNEAPRAERSAARRTKRRAPNEAPRAEASRNVVERASALRSVANPCTRVAHAPSGCERELRLERRSEATVSRRCLRRMLSLPAAHLRWRMCSTGAHEELGPERRSSALHSPSPLRILRQLARVHLRSALANVLNRCARRARPRTTVSALHSPSPLRILPRLARVHLRWPRWRMCSTGAHESFAPPAHVHLRWRRWGPCSAAFDRFQTLRGCATGAPPFVWTLDRSDEGRRGLHADEG
jgi:hypothetical protein